jgi:hypothetical protein
VGHGPARAGDLAPEVNDLDSLLVRPDAIINPDWIIPRVGTERRRSPEARSRTRLERIEPPCRGRNDEANKTVRAVDQRLIILAQGTGHAARQHHKCRDAGPHHGAPEHGISDWRDLLGGGCPGLFSRNESSELFESRPSVDNGLNQRAVATTRAERKVPAAEPALSVVVRARSELSTWRSAR